jgi:heme-degrading monooxygenase HmoA
MHARVTKIRFPPNMAAEVVGVARGLAPILNQQRGFSGLQVLTDPSVGEGLIVSFWATEADAEVSETNPSYIGQMSMMSSFLYGPLAPKTYEVNVWA